MYGLYESEGVVEHDCFVAGSSGGRLLDSTTLHFGGLCKARWGAERGRWW